MMHAVVDPVISVAINEPERSRFFPPETLGQLEQLGEVRIVDEVKRTDVARYAAELTDTDVVVTAWDCPPLTSSVLASAPRLMLMVNAASSVKKLVTPESWRRGVRVTQAGDAMAPAVAEAALTLSLALLRRVHRYDHWLRTGKPWTESIHDVFGREINGSVVGVVGASRVGRAYISMAQALGARVLVYDPYLTDADADALDVTRMGLPDLMQSSNIVSLHAPLTAETEQMIGRQELRSLRDGAGLVNTARPRLVELDALYTEVASGRIDAALDVHELEPLPEMNRWRQLPNALLTPHLGGKTIQSRRRAGQIVIDEIRRLLAGEPLHHEISEDMLSTIG